MKKIVLFVLLLIGYQTSQAQCWQSVSVGYSHVIAIANNGTLWAWGMNHFGQLGNGTQLSSTTPIQIGTDTDWKTVSAGSGPTSFNLALKNNNTLWSWGSNTYGQLGDGTFTHKFTPVAIGSNTNWNSISAGYSHALATKTDGTLWSWGNSEYYALGYGNGYGEGYHKNSPTQIGTLTTWKTVSAADRYSLALKIDGTVWGWGYNYGNPIGLNTGLYIMTPQQRSYNNTGVKAISAGGSHSFDSKTSNNLLVTWGSNVYGQTGGTTCAGCPEYFVKQFDCGDDTSAIIKTNGTLWYTGKKLGYTEPTVQYTSTFLSLSTATNWKSVSVGNQSGAAIDLNGAMWTWGWNTHGQLGNGFSGSNTHSLTLIPVSCTGVLAATSFKTTSPFALYPNPVTNELTIDNPTAATITYIRMYDMMGKLLLDTPYMGNTLNVAHLAAGSYVLQLEYEGTFDRILFLKK
jgi:alpha-tubulin suppressor-like RCC1 family protein